MQSRSLLIAGLTLGYASVAGCTISSQSPASPESPGTGYTVIGALKDVPVSSIDAQDPIQVVTANLVAATEAEGLERPGDASDSAAIAGWIGPLIGSGSGQAADSVFVPLPELFSRLSDAESFEDELGFDITDVRGYVEVSQPPRRLTVLALDEAAAESIADSGDGVIDVGDGDDLETSLNEATAARPLGRPLRLGVRGQFVAVALETAVVTDWLSEEPESLAEDDELADVAAALDRAEVISAALFRNDFAAAAAGGAQAAPEVTAPLEAAVEGIEAFGTVGVGWTEGETDTEAQAAVAYRFASADAADASLEPLEALYDTGTAVNGGPISDQLELLDIRADAQTVTATVAFTDDTPPGVLHQMVIRGDVIFRHE